MTMSDDHRSTEPVNGDVDVDVPQSTVSSVTHNMSNQTDNPSPGPMTSGGEVGGGVDSDSGGSLSSSVSPAPLPSATTHDDWNTNEPSDGADSGVGANGSTPVDGDALSLSFDGLATTASPAAYVMSPPFVPAHYPAGQPPVVHSPVISHSEDHFDGCTTTTGSTSNVMSSTATSQQQYVVNVHVNAGETFSVRAGDRVQLIHGNCISLYYKE